MRLAVLALATALLAACAGGAAAQSDDTYDPCQPITQLYKVRCKGSATWHSAKLLVACWR